MTTIYSIDVDQQGRILQASFHNGFTEEEVTGKIITKEMYEFILPNVDNFYYEDNIIKEKPLKPEGEYIFNYQTKQWEFDAVGADTKAKQKRDELLADGPDRINPMWWSSMTPEQQQAWTDYRQALLDVTGQAEYPQVIIWPTKPE